MKYNAQYVEPTPYNLFITSLRQPDSISYGISPTLTNKKNTRKWFYVYNSQP